MPMRPAGYLHLEKQAHNKLAAEKKRIRILANPGCDASEAVSTTHSTGPEVAGRMDQACGCFQCRRLAFPVRRIICPIQDCGYQTIPESCPAKPLSPVFQVDDIKLIKTATSHPFENFSSKTSIDALVAYAARIFSYPDCQ